MARYPIIIEGPDGAGKTTLAEKLCDRLGRQYTRPPEELLSSETGPTAGLPQWWDEQLAMGDRALAHRVFDRCFYISDPIYQMAQSERELLVSFQALASGIMRLWNVEPIIIFCLPDFGITLTNVRQENRPQLRGVSAEVLSKVYNMYWATYALWSNALYDNIMSYDYTEDAEWDILMDKLLSVKALA